MRLRTESGVDLTHIGGKVQDALMDLIDKMDRGSNVTGMLALADAVYRDMERINKEEGLELSEDYLKQEAMAAVGRALELAAQPKSSTQRALGQARGGTFGALANTLMLFRSEVVNKLGLSIARAMQGDYMAACWYLGFGAVNAVVTEALLFLFLDSYDDDEPKKGEEWKPYARFALNSLTGDLAAVPIIGDEISRLKAGALGDYHRQQGLIQGYFDITAIRKHIERIYSGEKACVNR